MKKYITVQDFNEIVRKHYGKYYNFQQQNGCVERQKFHITVPTSEEDAKLYDDIIMDYDDNSVNEYGVSFQKWLNTNIKNAIGDKKEDWQIKTHWQRHFYPSIYILTNDMVEKGLLEKGDYIIDIDW